MKTLTLIIFSFLSSMVFSAEITVDVNLDDEPSMSIEGSEFFGWDYCSQDWEESWSVWEPQEINLRSLRCKLVPYSGELPGSISANGSSGLEFLYKDSVELKHFMVAGTGKISSKTYLSLGNEFTQFAYINRIPYLLDEMNNVVWRWGQPTEIIDVNGVETLVTIKAADGSDIWTWIDISSEATLPAGQYVDLIGVYGNPIISVEGEGTTGMWNAHEDNLQLSEYALEGTDVATTPFGYMQLIVDSIFVEYKIKWMGTDKALQSTGINSVQYKHQKTIVIETGFLSVFDDENFNNIYFWRDSSGGSKVSKPEGTVDSYGCYESYPRAFCVFSNMDGDIVLYEFNDGAFRADTVLAGIELPYDSNIYGIVAIGDKRYISIKSKFGLFDKNTILMAGPDSLVEVFSTKTNEDEDDFSMRLDKSGASVSWVGAVDDEILIVKLVHFGQTDYVENVIGGSGQDGRIGDEEDKEFPRAEVGAFYFSILLSMLILLSVRRSEAKR